MKLSDKKMLYFLFSREKNQLKLSIMWNVAYNRSQVSYRSFSRENEGVRATSFTAQFRQTRPGINAGPQGVTILVSLSRNRRFNHTFYCPP